MSSVKMAAILSRGRLVNGYEQKAVSVTLRKPPLYPMVTWSLSRCLTLGEEFPEMEPISFK